VPDPVKVTLPEASEQPDEDLSNVTATVSLDVAVALGVYEPRSLPALGAPLTEILFDVVPAADAAVADTSDIPATSNAEVAPTATIRLKKRWGEIRKVRSRWFFIGFLTLYLKPESFSGQGCWVWTS
jgi:hypothetical protein